MHTIQQYTTLKSFSQYTFKEKGSEFIAQALPVETEEDYYKILSDIKKVSYDASHHCYAVRLLGDTVKYSDDGEPSGTAGLRILNAIDHFQLHRVIVVVTRYFGGTKLGVGPLGKAYYAAAEGALQNARKITKKAFMKIIIHGEFYQLGNIHHVLSYHKIKMLNTEYSENVQFNCYIDPADLPEIKKQLTDAAKGEIRVEEPGETLFMEAIE